MGAKACPRHSQTRLRRSPQRLRSLEVGIGQGGCAGTAGDPFLEVPDGGPTNLAESGGLCPSEGPSNKAFEKNLTGPSMSRGHIRYGGGSCQPCCNVYPRVDLCMRPLCNLFLTNRCGPDFRNDTGTSVDQLSGDVDRETSTTKTRVDRCCRCPGAQVKALDSPAPRRPAHTRFRSKSTRPISTPPINNSFEAFLRAMVSNGMPPLRDTSPA